MKANAVLFAISALALSMLFAHHASAQKFQVGVSPAFLDLGEVERGSSNLASFNVLTSSEESFLVDVKVAKSHVDFFKGEWAGYLKYFSEEDASSWVHFMSNPVYLDTPPDNQAGGIRKAEAINFLVNVPENAEPGYHVVEISPTPRVPGGMGGGIDVVTITKINVMFRVKGDAVRSGTILDASSRQASAGTRIDVYFHNNGTVTISAKADVIEVHDSEGKLAGTMTSSKEYIAPGQMVRLNSLLPDALNPGRYTASIDVNYYSGHSRKEVEFWVEAPKPAPPSGRVVEAAAFPWWFFALLFAIAAFSYWVYRKV